MAIAALVLALVAVAGLSVSLLVSSKIHNNLADRLRALETPKDIYQARYSPPPEDLPVADFPPELDIAGAWAMEQAAIGVRVTDEEIRLQRRMRAEAGL